jgi:uncharacterized membrane protein
MSRPLPDQPPRTMYHRALGWHAPTLVRTAVVLLTGAVVALVLTAFTSWQLAAVTGWDAAAATFLAAVWPLVLRADSVQTNRLASREDDTRTVAALLLLSVCVASLVGGGFALSLAGHRTGPAKVALLTVTGGTVLLSWLVLNTVYTLRYAHLYYGPAASGVDFRERAPDYRDFAYLAFTIGMTYQVSDTNLHNPVFRRAVLGHALLAYLFGVVIVAGVINLIAGILHG